MSSITAATADRLVEVDVAALALNRTIAGRSGWVVDVQYADGSRVIADLRDGESQWHVNGRWAPGSSFPIFWNGALARCTIAELASPELTGACNAAVVEHWRKREAAA